MNTAQIVHYYYSSGGQSEPWWLGGGAIPASTSYSIYDPLASSDLASSYINLANPGTRNATPIVAPTFYTTNYNAWQFNGTTQHLDTQTILGDASTVIAWVEDAAGVYLIGSYTNSPDRYVVIRPVSVSQTDFIKGTGSGGGFIGGATRGGLLALKSNAAYKNKITAFFSKTWTGATGTRSIYVGALNNNGTATNFASAKVLRLALYDIDLTQDQIFSAMDYMYNYNQPTVDSYSARVLALSPSCYYPCNQRIGSALFDLSGNNAHGESYFLPPGQAGKYGFSIAGDGDPNHFIRTIKDWAVRTSFNLNEYSTACWIKVNSDATNQVRVFNIYSGNGTEYSAVEIRTGVNIGMFCAENGATENSGTLANVVSGQWHHLVQYNSLSAGKYGIYLDGVHYERTKTLTGFVDTSPDEFMPLSAQDLNGNMQHLAYFNRRLTQSEVNTICT